MKRLNRSLYGCCSNAELRNRIFFSSPSVLAEIGLVPNPFNVEYSTSTHKFCWTITTSTFLHTRACDLTSEMLSRLYTHSVIVI